MTTHPHTLFPWRAPLSTDWIDRWAAVDARVRALVTSETDQPSEVEDVCLGLRRLANEQLGVREQLKLEGTARRLLPIADRLKPLRKFRIGLLGNRTLSYLINPLRAAGLARGLLMDAVEAPYDSVASFAYSGMNVFEGEKLDAVVMVLDLGAFRHDIPLLDRAAEDTAVAEAEAYLRQLAAAVRSKVGVPVILATLPPTSPRLTSAELSLAGTEERFAMRLNAAIIEGGAAGDWIVWDLSDIAVRVGLEAWFDPVRFHEAKIPFRIELCPLVADHLCRIVAAMAGKACRALVLDLDNTLWGGVIGDDGVAGIRIGQNSPEGEAYLAFQKFALELRRRGVVIAVSSKNTDEIAREPFRSHPEMLLKESHIAVFQANWEDKASNIKAIAEALDLGLESIAFVDDNPAERARVRQELPLVTVPEIGSEPSHYIARVCESGAFEHLVLNQDDAGRAESYENNARRAELQAKVGNYDDYLQSLKMKMTVSRFDDVGRARIAQLINKSNQFNLTTRRYNEEDIRRLEEDREGVLCWQARLDDTFGAHGMIGVIIARKAATGWTIDTWLQSCRVLARGVEETLMNLLVAHARDAGVAELRGEYIATARNGMVADFYPRLGFEEVSRMPDGATFLCRPGEYVPMKSFIDVDFQA
ncbi:MAG TPA: HAD family hydrolase [Rhizomicrobium sp.]|jgi:FkbH-like protein|nr:HAD family hydrolase [Rhizomicrobium sp.]